MHRKIIGFIASFMAITATGQNLMPSGSPLYKLNPRCRERFPYNEAQKTNPRVV